MQSGTQSWATFILILFPVCLILISAHVLLAGDTIIHITHGDSGKRISCNVLKDGENLSLSWTNSLFGLFVTETYAAQDGKIVQTDVTFADPDGQEPPHVRPEDVEDLYHTGGSFRAEGLSRTFQRIVFRVGEIGNPVLKIRDNTIPLAKEVGFGGTIVLESRPHSLNEKTCFSEYDKSP